MARQPHAAPVSGAIIGQAQGCHDLRSRLPLRQPGLNQNHRVSQQAAFSQQGPITVAHKPSPDALACLRVSELATLHHSHPVVTEHPGTDHPASIRPQFVGHVRMDGPQAPEVRTSRRAVRVDRAAARRQVPARLAVALLRLGNGKCDTTGVAIATIFLVCVLAHPCHPSE
jgi:hypothetical protein